MTFLQIQRKKKWVEVLKKIKIGKKEISDISPVFIIAEIGVNHNGNVETAEKLIDVAKQAGADCVKFQTFVSEEEISKNAPLAEYQKGKFSNQLDLVKNLELTENDFKNLKGYAENLELEFLSTPFDEGSVDVLEKIRVVGYKISSGDLNNIKLIKKIASTKKPIILSTGMASFEEIKESISWLQEEKTYYALLHCVSCYPTNIEDCNLLAISTLKEKFGVIVGFSDHTIGNEAALIATALGAKIIEKHITLDKTMNGPDHLMSMEPREFQKFVTSIRKAELAMGNGVKRCLPCEEEIKKVARKSIVSSRTMTKGEIINELDLKLKRPGTGIEPKYLDKMIGKCLKKNIEEDHLIKWDELD